MKAQGPIISFSQTSLNRVKREIEGGKERDRESERDKGRADGKEVILIVCFVSDKGQTFNSTFCTEAGLD